MPIESTRATLKCADCGKIYIGALRIWKDETLGGGFLETSTFASGNSVKKATKHHRLAHKRDDNGDRPVDKPEHNFFEAKSGVLEIGDIMCNVGLENRQSVLGLRKGIEELVNDTKTHMI